MRFSTFTAAILPLLAATPAVAQQESLEEWYSAVPWTFFPNQSNWEAGYDKVFSPYVKATFNFVEHDFDSLKEFFAGVYATVSTKYSEFYIDPIDTVVLPIPNNLGGHIYATGRETGVTLDGTTRVERNAAFGVIKDIDGERKIVEWRESTNFY